MDRIAEYLKWAGSYLNIHVWCNNTHIVPMSLSQFWCCTIALWSIHHLEKLGRGHVGFLCCLCKFLRIYNCFKVKSKKKISEYNLFNFSSVLPWFPFIDSHAIKTQNLHCSHFFKDILKREYSFKLWIQAKMTRIIQFSPLEIHSYDESLGLL